MVLFSVELQKLTVENQEEKFQGSRTLCVVRQKGGRDFCLYLHTWFMCLKPEIKF